MLFRHDLLTLGDEEAWRLVREVSAQAYALRLWLPDIPWLETEGDGGVIPSCHVTAHAFAHVFGYTAVDGEHVQPDGTKITDEDEEMDVHWTSYLHSWIEFATAKGNRFILDLFPDSDGGGSIFPVLFRAPHPLYHVPRTGERRLALDRLQASPEFKADVEELALKIRAIMKQSGLSSTLDRLSHVR